MIYFAALQLLYFGVVWVLVASEEWRSYEPKT